MTLGNNHSGWWFGNVWNINFIFPYIGNNHPNSQLTFLFLRGVGQPPTRWLWEIAIGENCSDDQQFAGGNWDVFFWLGYEVRMFSYTKKTSLYAIIWSLCHITSLYHILFSYYQFTISHVSLLNKQSLPIIYFCTRFLPSSAIAIWNQALPFHVPAAHRAGRVAAAAVADLLLGHLAAQGAGLWM